jgi:hypothetical protein
MHVDYAPVAIDMKRSNWATSTIARRAKMGNVFRLHLVDENNALEKLEKIAGMKVYVFKYCVIFD